MEVIETSDIKSTLEDCFATDLDLLNRYHIEAPAPLFKCVDRTYSDLLACDKIIYYNVFEKDKLIGYFCKEEYKESFYLTGFFLKPEYRIWETKKEFWSIINEKMAGRFYAGIYEKNTRAMKFLSKMGGEIFFTGIHKENKEKYCSYKFN